MTVFDGVVYFSESLAGRIYKITTSGGLETVAGSISPSPLCYDGMAFGPGDGGLASNAILCSPNGLRADVNGDLWIADEYLLRHVAASTGVITTRALCSGGDDAGWSCTDLNMGSRQGEVFVNNLNGQAVMHVAPGGVSQINVSTCFTSATSWFSMVVTGVAADGAGNAYVANYVNPAYVCKIAAGATFPSSTTATAFLGSPNANFIRCQCADGTKTCDALQVRLWYPDALSFGPDGHLYVVDAYAICIWQVVLATNVATVVYEVTSEFPGTLLFW